MENRHYFTPRFVNVEEARNAAEQQPQVINQSKANKLNIPKDDTLTCSPMLQIVREMTKHETINSFVVKNYSMTFDKLRIGYTYYTSKARPFKVVNQDLFECRYTKSGGCYYEYRHPKIDLYIRYGLKENDRETWELIIECTSTVLQERMMELISNDNIREILQMLDTDYHLIRILDIEDFISKAYVYACDVTKDLHMTLMEAKVFQKFTYNNRNNTHKSKVDLWTETNFILENKVKTASKKKVRLTFYDKHKKLERDRQFYKLPWGFNVDEQYGKYRLELVLKNRELVKEYLNLRDNTLREVLNSREQPISRFYWELIKCPVSIQPFVWKNRKEYLNYLIAKDCDFDLAKIEERLRMFYHPWRTSLLIPFIRICNGRKKMQKAMRDFTTKVKELLTIRYEERRKVANLVG